MSHLTINGPQMAASPFLEAAEKLNAGHNIATLELITNDPGDTHLDTLGHAIDRSERLKAVMIKRLAATSSTSYHIFCATLALHSTLTTISLYQFPLNHASILTLTHNLPSNGTLRRLSLKHCQLESFHARQIAKLIQRHTNLQSLNLRLNQITNVGARAITGATAHNCTLVSLDLSHNKMTAKGLAEIAHDIGKSSSLRRFVLQGYIFNKVAGKALAQAIMRSISLQEVHIGHFGQSIKALYDITSALSNSRYIEKAGLNPGPLIRAEDLQKRATDRFSVSYFTPEDRMTFTADSRSMSLDLPNERLPLSTEVAKVKHLDLTNYQGEKIIDPRLDNKVTHLSLHNSTIDAAVLAACKHLQSLTLDGSNIRIEQDEHDGQDNTI